MERKLKTCLLIVILQIINSITAQEVVKRVPQGFYGMRGKKYTTEDLEHLYKRRPQFFVGVKGKKSFLDLLEEQQYKRAPMGFVGMRGKKDIQPFLKYPDLDILPKTGSLIGQIDYSSSDDLTSLSQFSYLKHFLAEYLNDLEKEKSSIEYPNFVDESENQTAESKTEETTSERISNEVEKRAANYHQFYGMRGKKSIQDKRPFDVKFRGKFIGVRGKKDAKESDGQEIKFLVNHDEPWPKRKGQMSGFFGMRGKKWSEDTSGSTELI